MNAPVAGTVMSCTAFFSHAASAARHSSAARLRVLVMGAILWLGDPERLGVVIEREATNGIEARAIPHILGVVPRTDALGDLAAVVRIQVDGRCEAREYLLATGRIDVGVVIAAEVHPRLVVSPRPQRD